MSLSPAIDVPPCPREELNRSCDRFMRTAGTRVRLIWAPTDTVLQARCQRVLREVWWHLAEPDGLPCSADIAPAALNGLWANLVWADRLEDGSALRYRFVGERHFSDDRGLADREERAPDLGDRSFLELQWAIFRALRHERQLLQVIIRNQRGGEWSLLLAPFGTSDGTVTSVLSANVVSGRQGRILQQRYRDAVRNGRSRPGAVS